MKLIFCLKATKKQENNKLCGKNWLPARNSKPKSNKNKINQEKCFFPHPRNLPFRKIAVGHEERQQVKKQRLYRWLRLVFYHWDVISPIFKFSDTVRKVIYTTNAIESLNSTYRKVNRQRSVFPSDKALLKALFLSTFEATKKWTTTLRNWAQVYGELSIIYEGRLPE